MAFNVAVMILGTLAFVASVAGFIGYQWGRVERKGRASVQQQVAAAVAARGYRKGWTTEQFAARQVAKLMEELGELAEMFFLSTKCNREGNNLDNLIDGAATFAGERFDDPDDWAEARPIQGTIRFAKKELADIQVIVFTLAQALSEIEGDPLDSAQAALAKAAADIGRGVR
jgi:hypothetical protein